MFCELIGSTALAARLDPEDMREIIGVYRRGCAETISTAGGFVAKYMVDGVVAYFGYIPIEAVVSDHREPGRLK